MARNANASGSEQNNKMMSFQDIPGRAFLDTSVVNFILDYGEHIHEGVPPPENLNHHVTRDIDSLYNIFLTGQRALWQLAVSPQTYKEVTSTTDPNRRYYLENWFLEVWQYWCDIIGENNDLPIFAEAEKSRVELLSSGILDILPDVDDRVLVCDAISYRCNCFCTRDWGTILKHRDALRDLPIRISTPTEWWSIIEPYSSLF